MNQDTEDYGEPAGFVTLYPPQNTDGAGSHVEVVEVSHEGSICWFDVRANAQWDHYTAGAAGATQKSYAHTIGSWMGVSTDQNDGGCTMLCRARTRMGASESGMRW